MAHHYLDDPRIRRNFILYEFQKKRPIFESFDKLCETMGTRFMDYKEFEFWFQRFSSGNFDLDYDPSQDPKTRTLTDLPIEVVRRIGDKLDKIHRFTLRNVCRSLRALVDTWEPKFKRVEVHNTAGPICVVLDRGEFQYKASKRGQVTVVQPWSLSDYTRSGEKRDVALNDVMSILRHPKLELDSFEYTREKTSRILTRDLERRLKKENVRIRAKSFTLSSDCLEDEIRLLRHFQPGVLKTIDLDHTGGRFSEKLLELLMEILSRSETCQNAEHILIGSGVTKHDKRFTIPRLLTLPRVTLRYEKLEMSAVVEIFKLLLKSATLQLYAIKIASRDLHVTTLKQALLKFGAKFVDRNRTDFLIYRNPNSVIDEHFEIQLRGYDWSIERKRN